MAIYNLAGTTLGNYEIESLLGRGGMGVVYKARQVSLNRTVALKILSPHLSSDKSFVKQFQREARAVAQLNHQNIAYICDVREVAKMRLHLSPPFLRNLTSWNFHRNIAIILLQYFGNFFFLGRILLILPSLGLQRGFG